jgi:hypothetical protein
MKKVTTLFLAFAILAMAVTTAQAVPTSTYALDPVASSIKISITTVTNEFGPTLTLAHFAQAAAIGVVPGSIVPGPPPFGGPGDVAHYSGFLKVRHDPGVSIEFTDQCTVDALDSGIWLPADGLGPLYPTLPDVGMFPPFGLPPGAPAEYGHVLPGGGLGAALTAIRGLAAAIVSGPLPAGGGVFPAAGAAFDPLAGGIDFNSYGTIGAALGFGSLPIGAIPAVPNFLAGAGTIVGPVLTIPIALVIPIPLDPPPDPVTTVTLTLSGVLVATLIPEPSTYVLAVMGLVGLIPVIRKRLRR